MHSFSLYIIPLPSQDREEDIQLFISANNLFLYKIYNWYVSWWPHHVKHRSITTHELCKISHNFIKGVYAYCGAVGCSIQMVSF